MTQGDRGDKDVRRALEWIWAPYRDGKVWWIGAEMMRVLFLTSLVGAFAGSCETRVLAALRGQTEFHCPLQVWPEEPLRLLH